MAGRLAIAVIPPLHDKGEKEDEKEDKDEMGDEREGLKASAQSVLDAIDDKDADALSDALYEFFEQCDAMPHKEGKHEEEDEG
jgi:hypothetical protein